jgi:hypothetical protein
MSKEEWKKTLLDGASTYFEYKKKKATINLQNYLENPAGIGEHGDLVGECIKLIEDIENADGCLETIRNIG